MVSSFSGLDSIMMSIEMFDLWYGSFNGQLNKQHKSVRQVF